jgi:hypothetical protein
MAKTVPTAPPAGYAVSRSLTVAVYSKAGRPDVYLRTDGSDVILHRAPHNVAQDLLNRLTPPPR